MKRRLQLREPDDAVQILGTGDRNLRFLKKAFGVSVVVRQAILTVEGNRPNVEKALRALREMEARVNDRQRLDEQDVRHLLDAIDKQTHLLPDNRIPVFLEGVAILPRSQGQERYLEAIRKNHVTFSIGPAGTGKTYLAVALAVSALKEGAKRRIVLARPAVEAGEKLGFLPGDLLEKVNPYLRPLYDALHDMMDFAQVQRFMERDVIEVVPLAFMRGRTLNHAFVILDEAQNTTSLQMKMFLTRLGEHSKAVITGDITQIDLPEGEVSGLVEAQSILRGIRGIGFARLSREDIVRHQVVQEIVDAYETRRPSSRGRRRSGQVDGERS